MPLGSRITELNRAARFWAKVRVGDADECWPFMAAKDRDGYGITKKSYGATKAHRVAFILSREPIESGLVVCHSCDNPCCCNPDHLFTGTVEQNNADRAAKGRYRHRRVKPAPNERQEPRSIEERFWEKVKCGGVDECWPFLGCLNEHGYGVVNASYGSRKAHRVAYQLANGPIPAGCGVLHRCDNPICVNPAHLFIGSQRDNMADMNAKGRYRGGGRPGQITSRSKLTPHQVTEIRVAYAEGNVSQPILARRYGVGQSMIWAIVNRKVWKCVV